ncbi:DUF2306 domain-containing protein [Chitinibacter sp. ZOR0017]|uniref:DUF2306 domain-containing protein n=1 Tax=Chitinibacter sp. ZOR0017 TaxID=1339254 RepID=UPI000646BA89|nr:DUF2306 domain-containing protein [Chitinibacter sp. ZOR0017]
MSIPVLVQWHLATVVPAFGLGSWLLWRRKGDALHRWLGRVYVLLMLGTATISLLIPASIGPVLFSHWGLIHLFSLLVWYEIPTAVLAARRGQIAVHRAKMRGVYLGALVVAGSLAFLPGRLLNQLAQHWLGF